MGFFQICIRKDITIKPVVEDILYEHLVLKKRKYLLNEFKRKP